MLNRTKVGTEGVTGTPKSLKERAEKEVGVKSSDTTYASLCVILIKGSIVSVVGSCTSRGAIRSFKPRRRKLMSAKISI